MGQNRQNAQSIDGWIKGAIAETIADRLFRELGLYTVRFGKEHLLPPLKQLEPFIRLCGGHFRLERIEEGKTGSKVYLDKLPDFLIITRDGKMTLIEVKHLNESNSIENYKKLEDPLFQVYPTVKILFILSSIQDDYLDTIEADDVYKELLRNTHFHLFGAPDEVDSALGAEDPISVIPFFAWLELHGIKADIEIVQKYEKLVSKWLPTNYHD